MIDFVAAPEAGVEALQLLLKVGAVIAGAWLVAAGLRRSSAAIRHFVWTTAVAGLLLLTALSLALPSWEIPVIPAVQETFAAGEFHPRVEPGTVVEPRPRSAVPEWEGPVAWDPAPGVMGSTATLDGAPLGSRSATEPAAQWSVWLIAIWVLGALVLLIRLVIGSWGLREFAREAVPVEDAEWTQLLKDAVWLLDVHRPIRLLRGDRTSMPVTWGTARPTILLPPEADDWDAERRRVVLLHEVAHVKRHDCLTQLLASVACALYWFHPLVWVAARRLRVERERACDDVVLSTGERASAYAGHLLEVARAFRPAAPIGIAAIAMARPSQLEGRLLAVLDDRRKRSAPGRRVRIGVAALAFLVLLPLATARAVAADPRLGDGVAERVPDPETAFPDELASADVTDAFAPAPARRTLIPEDSTFVLSIDARPGRAVRLDLSTGATIRLTGWDQDLIVVRGRVSGASLDDIPVELSSVADGVLVRSGYPTASPGEREGGALEVFVPHRSALDVASAGGDLSIRSLQGSVIGRMAGDVVLEEVVGNVSFRTGGGNITVSRSELRGDMSTGGGDVRLLDVRGTPIAVTGGGDIEVDRLSASELGTFPGSVFVTGGGDVTIGRTNVPLEVVTGGGDIRVGASAEAVNARTGGGSIRIGEATGGVAAKTGGGTITIGQVSGTVELNSGSGEISARVAPGAPYRNVDIVSGHGNVTLIVPDDFGGIFDLQAATHDGPPPIRSDFDLSVDAGGRASGRSGNGDNRVRIRAHSGEIILRRASIAAAAAPTPTIRAEDAANPAPTRIKESADAFAVDVSPAVDTVHEVDPVAFETRIEESASRFAVEVSTTVVDAVLLGVETAVSALPKFLLPK